LLFKSPQVFAVERRKERSKSDTRFFIYRLEYVNG
jgi:hypothetical protein